MDRSRKHVSTMNVVSYCLLMCNALHIIVPGFTGSQLETKVNSDSNCRTNWTGLWVNVKRGASVPDCFLNELTYVI